jgi:aryl-alcohol dehydrogenase-like predicted oxidoreductase
MDYVPLGRSGLVTSVVGLGGGSSSRFGLVKGGTRSDALALIRAAFDQGITFFDGAGICGDVDELMAEALVAVRNDVLISTKVHLGPDPVPFRNVRLANRASSWIARRRGLICSASTLGKRVERTLRTLRTDRLDVLHLHAVSIKQYPRVVSTIVPELLELKRTGKVRAFGVTEGFLTDPDHAMLREAVGDGCFDTVMVAFNCRNSGASDFVLPCSRKKGIGTIGMFAMRGLLGWRMDELRKIQADAAISSLSEGE